MRIVFMGTPEFAKITLAELIGAGHEIVAVYTQPPRPAGRGMARQPSPVHAFALQQGLEVRHPTSLKSEHEQSAFRALDASAAVVVAYGLLLPAAVLQAPREGCFNLHGSELPRWRGAAPIQRAIMAGDTHTAVMVMRMDEGLDTGPVCLGERIEIGAEMTAGELHDAMAIIGAGLMVRALAALERGSLTSTPQSAEGITYAAKIAKAEARIDFGRPAHEVHNKIRGLSPYPGAWFEVEFGGKRERIKALKSRLAEGSGAPGEIVAAGQSLRIGCGDGVVELISVQRAGKKSCSAAEFLRGCKITLGMHLPTA